MGVGPREFPLGSKMSCFFFLHEMPIFPEMYAYIFKKPIKMKVVQRFSNTPSKREGSTAMGTHFRSSAKDINLGS